MKTTCFKITMLILTGLFCLTFYPASASKHVIRYKNRSAVTRRYSSSALAKMKIKNIEFGFNKAMLPEHANENLDRIAKLIIENNASVKLGGYADNIGAYVYNWKLSKARAEAVKTYLVNKGVDSSRIAATEYGSTHPIASNKTIAGRKQNRRVEIHFVS